MALHLRSTLRRRSGFHLPVSFDHAVCARRAKITQCTLSKRLARSVEFFDSTDALALPFADREAVLSAMETLDFQATAAEVAASAGLGLLDAERTMQWLAYEVKGSMKVWSSIDHLVIVLSTDPSPLVHSNLRNMCAQSMHNSITCNHVQMCTYHIVHTTATGPWNHRR
jgi:hypothetical protein